MPNNVLIYSPEMAQSHWLKDILASEKLEMVRKLTVRPGGGASEGQAEVIRNLSGSIRSLDLVPCWASGWNDHNDSEGEEYNWESLDNSLLKLHQQTPLNFLYLTTAIIRNWSVTYSEFIFSLCEWAPNLIFLQLSASTYRDVGWPAWNFARSSECCKNQNSTSINQL